MRMNKAERSCEGRLEFNLLYAIAFIFFLAAIAASRLLPRGLRWHVSSHEDGKSVFAAARAAASNSLPFAFM